MVPIVKDEHFAVGAELEGPGIINGSVNIRGTVVGMSVGGTYNAYTNADFRTDLTTGTPPAPGVWPGRPAWWPAR